MAKWLRSMKKGRSSFQLLQALEMEGQKSPICFYVFDLLQLEGKSLISTALGATETISRTALRTMPAIQFVSPARSAGTRGRCSRKLNAAAWRELSASAAIPFTNRAGGAAPGSNSSASTSRSSSSAVTPHQADRGNISARFWSGITRNKSPNVCRQSWIGIYSEIIVDLAQEIPRRRARTIVRLPICPQSREANGCKGSRRR